MAKKVVLRACPKKHKGLGRERLRAHRLPTMKRKTALDQQRQGFPFFRCSFPFLFFTAFSFFKKAEPRRSTATVPLAPPKKVAGGLSLRSPHSTRYSLFRVRLLPALLCVASSLAREKIGVAKIATPKSCASMAAVLIGKRAANQRVRTASPSPGKKGVGTESNQHRQVCYWPNLHGPLYREGSACFFSQRLCLFIAGRAIAIQQKIK